MCWNVLGTQPQAYEFLNKIRTALPERIRDQLGMPEVVIRGGRAICSYSLREGAVCSAKGMCVELDLAMASGGLHQPGATQRVEFRPERSPEMIELSKYTRAAEELLLATVPTTGTTSCRGRALYVGEVSVGSVNQDKQWSWWQSRLRAATKLSDEQLKQLLDTPVVALG